MTRSTSWIPDPDLPGYVTDGGLETDLIHHHGVDLPEFAAKYHQGDRTVVGGAGGHAGVRGVSRRSSTSVSTKSTATSATQDSRWSQRRSSP